MNASSFLMARCLNDFESDARGWVRRIAAARSLTEAARLMNQEPRPRGPMAAAARSLCARARSSALTQAERIITDRTEREAPALSVKDLRLLEQIMGGTAGRARARIISEIRRRAKAADEAGSEG